MELGVVILMKKIQLWWGILSRTIREKRLMSRPDPSGSSRCSCTALQGLASRDSRNLLVSTTSPSSRTFPLTRLLTRTVRFPSSRRNSYERQQENLLCKAVNIGAQNKGPCHSLDSL